MESANQGRIPELIPIRHGRMLRSPFTFYRGAALNMAADLASTPDTGMRVQACGDAHLCNFGAFATPERRVIFDINDLDETLPCTVGMGRKAAGREHRPCQPQQRLQRKQCPGRHAGLRALVPRAHG